MSFQLQENEIQVKCLVVYPSLAEPNNSGTYASGKYEATIIINDRDEAKRYKNFVAAMAKAEKVASTKTPCYLGNQKVEKWDIENPDKAGQKDFFKDSFFCTAKTKYQPQVISFQKGFKRVEAEELVSGAECIVTLRIFKATGKGYNTLAAGLGNIAIIKNATSPLGYSGGAARKAEDEFAAFRDQYAAQAKQAEAAGNTEGGGFYDNQEDVPFFDNKGA